MRIDRLELDSFRNYGRQAVDFDGRCNVIFGENAQGKTNLLEALVYLSCGKSPRARTDREMIRFDAPAASLCAQVFARERDFKGRVELFRDRRRKMFVNQVPAKNSGALSEVYNTVFFCPEDLFLIREGAAARRKFMDTALCQLRPNYEAALSEYNRILEQKNRILKDRYENPALLEILPEYNDRLCQVGALLISYRARFYEGLGREAKVFHETFSGGKESFRLEYQTVSTISDPFAPVRTLEQQLWEHLERHYQAELSSSQCLTGPHKDDFDITLNDLSIKAFGSQGQVRTATISLKLAQRALMRKETGEIPVLLLDDVLSELDAGRQDFVLNQITEGQVFITCCEPGRFTKLGKTIRIQNGQVIY